MSASHVERAGFLEYMFPLRDDFKARLVLPKKLTKRDVERLEAFLTTLVEES
jgi:hypothetical protein